MGYCDWLSTWLDIYVKPSVKSKTYADYSATVRCHIAPHLGESDLNELSAMKLQSFAADLLGRNGVATRLATTTVRQILMLVRASLV